MKLNKRYNIIALVLSLALTLAPVFSVSAQEHDTGHGDSAAVTQTQEHGGQENAGAHAEGDGEHHGTDIGQKLPLWSVIPFAGILLSIAIFPLVAPHFWHKHFPKISAAWAIIFAVQKIYV